MARHLATLTLAFTLGVLGSCTADTAPESVDQAVDTVCCGVTCCFIDGMCRTTGARNPANMCEECRPSTGQLMWSPVAGCVAMDSGAPPVPDAGAPDDDAGSEPLADAGGPVEDAGAPGTDAGTPGTDSGVPRTDSGSPRTDSGMAGVDAGGGGGGGCAVAGRNRPWSPLAAFTLAVVAVLRRRRARH